ncbi:MAG: class I SAM-dependent methyltransferase [Bdellovibrionaceae bacterium]|nr:class I SAM-dependent methyltransferase [Pseudobdellovibrionaceae bacterium]
MNEQYKDLCDQWTAFLKPFENTVNHISIEYSGPSPLLLDVVRRKFQIDFENNPTSYSKIKGGINSEPISRALGAGKFGKRVLDLSAGLGVDSVFLAQLGYQVTGVERNPFIYVALKTALENLTANYRTNLKFAFDHAQKFLQNNTQEFDVCYFDPMFPSKTKSALPKQEMVFFKNLVGSDEDAATVLEMILRSKKFKRCVVKRPLSAEPLLKPAGHIKGKIIRYDIYSS